jgi:hypothetical protein
MTDKSLCLNEAYDRCAIFAVEPHRSKDRSGADVHEIVEQTQVGLRIMGTRL